MPPARWTSSMWKSLLGETFARHGTRADRVDVVEVKSSSASWAAARMCSTVLVDPPMAMSRAMAFSKAAWVAMLRGSTLASSCSY